VSGSLPFRVYQNLLADIFEGGAKELMQERKEDAFACAPLPDEDWQHLKGVLRRIFHMAIDMVVSQPPIESFAMILSHTRKWRRMASS
jgi:hypothetical protein